ncbi:MAG: mannose-6-phosphate isomerase [Acidobacteria bacterium]|nr:mannose-6-phosphate isomerase [Acidobacteriota bacterium]
MNYPARDPHRTPPSPCGYPLKLEPQFVERVWGAACDSEQISFLYPPDHSSQATEWPQRVGEVWLTGNGNRIANGAHTGKTLQEVTRDCGATLLGDSPSLDHPSGQPLFPLLIKILFTTDKLSVQVHPPDSYAAQQGSWGKTEMWHILRAAPGARLAVGFRRDIPRGFADDPAKLRQAAESGSLEQLLDWREVHDGETYFVPAGTVHAIGAGLTLCEIQQNSDITYRLYDYNRPGTDGQPRALHLEEALKVIEWRTSGGRTSPFNWPGGAGKRRLLAACPYFLTERWEFPAGAMGDEKQKQVVRFAPDDGVGRRPVIWTALEGAAEFDAGGERAAVRQGEVVVIPADAGTYTVGPLAPSVFLRTFPVDWDADVVSPLRAAGASEAEMTKVCFPLSAAAEETKR